MNQRLAAKVLSAFRSLVNRTDLRYSKARRPGLVTRNVTPYQ